MMEFDEEEVCDPLKSLMNMLKGRMPDYEPHCPIPADVLEQWNVLIIEISRAEAAVKIADAKKTLFWASLEERLGIYGRSLRLDVANNMIMIEKPKEKII